MIPDVVVVDARGETCPDVTSCRKLAREGALRQHDNAVNNFDYAIQIFEIRDTSCTRTSSVVIRYTPPRRAGMMPERAFGIIIGILQKPELDNTDHRKLTSLIVGQRHLRPSPHPDS